MLNRAAESLRAITGRRWPTPSLVVAGVALFVALGGSAVAATLIKTKDIANSAVTSGKIRNGTITLTDINARTRASLKGAKGESGSAGSAGAPGSQGAKGSDGAGGARGADGADGTNGANGAPGTDGSDGIIAPLSATQGATPLLTATPPTAVVELTVPSGNYVVLAKTQVTHTGAGDTVECVLKAGSTPIDRVSMKTLPALAAIPMSMQAVTTSAATQLSVECDVTTAGGQASSSSLIAIPIG